MKQWIPAAIRVELRASQRQLRDRISGVRSQLAERQPMSAAEQQRFLPHIRLTQTIMVNPHAAQKRHNLAVAIEHLQDVAIAPEAIFSFWHWVGKPSRQRGYVAGRAIVGNQLRTEIGGGLCQLSGLIYVLMLKAGLNPLERHPHSHDIYTDATRFAPLGSDATVVYGYKDLRFVNQLDQPICFRFVLEEQALTGMLCAPRSLPEFHVDFQLSERNSADGSIQIDTLRWQNDATAATVINSTRYRQLVQGEQTAPQVPLQQS